ncbi:MAG TPA: hypothetical protein ENK57_15005, partial [Polyangiaceae bacterium]|nr:hypothetical protein [Polyangiaceae bacterium]
MIGRQETALEQICALEAAGSALRTSRPELIAEHLATAFERLLDPAHALGRQALERLPKSSGLTAPMVRWALNHTL